MAFYKVTINSIESASGGYIHADAFIKLRTSRNPDVFVDVPGGHRTVVISADEIITISNDSGMTNNQKRNAIENLIKAKVLEFGIDKADEAWGNMTALLTPPFDISIRDT